MLKILKTKTAKISGLVVAFTMLATSSASAMTAAECAGATTALTALGIPSSTVSSLLASQCGGSTSGSSYDFGTATMKVGSTGTYVMNLQKFLGISADGKFGPMTAAAVKAWQANNGLTADGVFGAMSRAKAMSMGGASTSTGTGTSTSTTLSGGAGALASSTPTVLSQYNNEDVGEGEEDVIVAGWELEADDNSDLSLTSVKVKLDGSSNTGSTTASKYFEEVSVMFDGKTVATVDIDDFSKSSTGIYSTSVNLSNAVLKAGKKGKLTVAVSAVDTIDSSNMSGDAWTVDVESVRYVDATNAILTENLTISPVTINFGTFASTTDLEMKVALHNSNLKSTVVEVDTTSDTDNVELLKFTVEAQGSDVTIFDLPVLLTATGATDVDAIANTLILKAGSEEFSETITSSTAYATITFDDIDYVIEEGEKVTFTVLADINDIETGFDEGDTLKAELTSTMIDAIVAEDKNGDNISDADATGTALGEAMAFYSTGIRVTFVDKSSKVASAGTSTNDDVGEFTLSYKVEAFGGTVYVSDTATATTATSFSTVPSNQVLYTTSVGGTATASGLSGLVTFTTSGGASDTGVTNGVALEEGESATFTLTVSRTNTSSLLGSGIWQMAMKGISWATSDTATQNVYYFNLDDYKTSPVTLN